jgi:hypothetical protein
MCCTVATTSTCLQQKDQVGFSQRHTTGGLQVLRSISATAGLHEQTIQSRNGLEVGGDGGGYVLQGQALLEAMVRAGPRRPPSLSQEGWPAVQVPPACLPALSPHSPLQQASVPGSRTSAHPRRSRGWYLEVVVKQYSRAHYRYYRYFKKTPSSS